MQVSELVPEYKYKTYIFINIRSMRCGITLDELLVKKSWGAPTIQDLTTPLDCPLELDGDILLLKTSDVLVVRY